MELPEAARVEDPRSIDPVLNLQQIPVARYKNVGPRRLG